MDTSIFSNGKIAYIKKLDNGNTLFVIWLKLLIHAGIQNDNGYVRVTQRVAYPPEVLSRVIDEDEVIVLQALDLFEKLDMIEFIDGFIYISNWEKYQNTEGLERIKRKNRERQRRYRERKKQEENSNIEEEDSEIRYYEEIDSSECHALVTQSNNVTATLCNSLDDHRIDNNRIDKNRIDKNRIDQGRIDNNRVDQGRIDNNRVDNLECHALVTQSNNVTVTSHNALDKSRVDKNRIDNNIYSIFEHWNSLSLPEHREETIFNKMKRVKSIQRAIDDYTLETVLEAITLYDTVLNSKDYWFSYSWSLWDFCDRGVEKFRPESNPLINFSNNKKENVLSTYSKEDIEDIDKIFN